MRAINLVVLVLVSVTAVWSLHAQDPEPTKRKTAVIQWVADVPQLTYDIRYAGGDSANMPTALKYLAKDLAEGDGWYLTGEDKSKTVASQTKRMTLETTRTKSKLVAARVSKVDVKELPGAISCVVVFSKKPGAGDLKRLDSVLETFARKYAKVAKGIPATVEHSEMAKANQWSFDVRFNEAAKAKK